MEFRASAHDRSGDSRAIVLGNFNQRIPRKLAPKRVHEELLRVFEPFEIATTGQLSGASGLAIDHLAHAADLTDGGIGLWPGRSVKDQPLSDHFGVWCDLGLAC